MVHAAAKAWPYSDGECRVLENHILQNVVFNWMTEGAFSIKKIVKESATRIVLHPLNADYPPIPLPPNSHDYAIVGTLRKVLRTDARSTSAEPPHPHL